jgi:hypothetical protein
MISDIVAASAELNIPVYPPSSGEFDPAAPAPPPTIVHLSIRPVPPPGEEDTKKGKRKMSTSSGVDDGEVRPVSSFLIFRQT